MTLRNRLEANYNDKGNNLNLDELKFVNKELDESYERLKQKSLFIGGTGKFDKEGKYIKDSHIWVRVIDVESELK